MIDVNVNPIKIPDGDATNNIVIHILFNLSLPKASAQTGVKIDMKT
jgi:hypothetical protein